MKFYQFDIFKLTDYNEFIDDITNIKKPSYLIIDDRCINFGGNYDDLIDKINHFKVWYR